MKKIKLNIRGFFERYCAYFSTILLFVGMQILNDNINVEKFLDKLTQDNVLELIITIESTLFGFVLAILAIILQLNNKAIELIKKLNRYSQLILHNKESVYSSIVIVVYSVIILMVNDFSIFLQFKYILAKILLLLLVFNVVTVKVFIKIFYLLAKQH